MKRMSNRTLPSDCCSVTSHSVCVSGRLLVWYKYRITTVLASLGLSTPPDSVAQYLIGVSCDGSMLNRFFRVTRSRLNLSSGEKRAG